MMSMRKMKRRGRRRSIRGRVRRSRRSKGSRSRSRSRSPLITSASSTMAGRRDWESCWMPMTSLTQSRFEMMFSRTSGHSSFNWGGL